MALSESPVDKDFFLSLSGVLLALKQGASLQTVAPNALCQLGFSSPSVTVILNGKLGEKEFHCLTGLTGRHKDKADNAEMRPTRQRGRAYTQWPVTWFLSPGFADCWLLNREIISTLSHSRLLHKMAIK